MSMYQNKFLDTETHHSNMDLPYSKYVQYDVFPDQNKDLLSKIVSLKIRNRYEVDRTDEDYGVEEVFDDEYANIEANIWVHDFIVIRCDLTEPYRMVCVSTDYTKLVVTDSRKYDPIIQIYPIQIYELLGYNVEDRYMVGPNKTIDGIVIGCDNGEPCNSVIVESLPEIRSIRIVLEDECRSKLGKLFKINNIDCYYREEQIALLRKTLIEGKKLYGIS